MIAPAHGSRGIDSPAQRGVDQEVQDAVWVALSGARRELALCGSDA